VFETRLDNILEGMAFSLMPPFFGIILKFEKDIQLRKSTRTEPLRGMSGSPHNSKMPDIFPGSAGLE